MSSARPEQQLGLPEKTWKPLTELIEKTGQKDVDIHCHMPICIGYKGSINGNELLAAIKSVVAKEGYDYTVYLAPKDAESLDNWKQENADVLRKIPEDRIMHIDEWRHQQNWHNASEAYSNYMQKPERKEAVDHVISTDIDNFARRNKQVDTNESRQHVISEVTDVISWMSPKGSPLDEISVVMMFGHRFTQAMQNAHQNADELGYVKDSIVGVKYRPEMVEVKAGQQHENKQPRVQTLYEAQPAQNTGGHEAGSPPEHHDTVAIYYLLDRGAAAQDPSFVANVIRNLGSGAHQSNQSMRQHSDYRVDRGAAESPNVVRFDVPLNQSGPGQVYRIDAISGQDSQLLPRPRRRVQKDIPAAPSSYANSSVMFSQQRYSQASQPTHQNGARPMPGRRGSGH